MSEFWKLIVAGAALFVAVTALAFLTGEQQHPAATNVNASGVVGVWKLQSHNGPKMYEAQIEDFGSTISIMANGTWQDAHGVSRGPWHVDGGAYVFGVYDSTLPITSGKALLDEDTLIFDIQTPWIISVRMVYMRSV